jgi:hypothetical protein
MYHGFRHSRDTFVILIILTFISLLPLFLGEANFWDV